MFIKQFHSRKHWLPGVFLHMSAKPSQAAAVTALTEGHQSADAIVRYFLIYRGTNKEIPRFFSDRKGGGDFFRFDGAKNFRKFLRELHENVQLSEESAAWVRTV